MNGRSIRLDWNFRKFECLKVSEVTIRVLGDEPEGVGLAEIGLIYSLPQCCGKPHEERDAKVSEAETQFCQNM